MINTLTSEQKDALLTTLWDRSLVGVALLSADGRFEYANKAFTALTEYSEPELRKKRFNDITHPDDLYADVQMSKEVASGSSEGYSMKKRYITKTGKLVWIILQVDGLVLDGTMHFFISQISEIFPIIGVSASPNHRLSDRPSPWTSAQKFVKDNLPWIIVVCGSAGLTIAEVLKALGK